MVSGQPERIKTDNLYTTSTYSELSTSFLIIVPLDTSARLLCNQGLFPLVDTTYYIEHQKAFALQISTGSVLRGNAAQGA